MTLIKTDVLIIGSGPAGSAAAQVISNIGHQVLLVDRHPFPRDKVCGDALIPDSLNALARLGLKEKVLSEAVIRDSIRIYAPNGSYVTLRSELACLPRQRLDDLLREAAVENGTIFKAPYGLIRALEKDGSVTGAILATPSGNEEMIVDATFTILATGAAVRPLEIFGVCERRAASAMAARVYVKVPSDFIHQYDHFCISYDKHICPGYGWIFPSIDNTFNVGVGYFNDTKVRPPTTNLRHLLKRFTENFPPAKALMSVAEPLTDIRGAPLRTSLTGSRLSKPGLLVVGEAAGLTYSFSGEGIGKAIESGIIAGEIVSSAISNRTTEKSEIAELYSSAIKSNFADRFHAYKIAQDWLTYPALADFLAWRANSGNYVRQQLEGLLGETTNPRELFSASGLFKSLIM